MEKIITTKNISESFFLLFQIPIIFLNKTNPVLIAIISIKGFFLTFGKLSDAPPVFFPSNFFCPNNLTE